MENRNQLSDSFLDELFQEAKLDSPAISIEEIRDLVQAEPLLYKKFGARKWSIIIASFLLVGLVCLFYFQSPNKDEQSSNFVQKEEQKVSIISPVDSLIQESNSLVSTLPKPSIPLPKMQNRIRFEPKPDYPETAWPLINPAYAPNENSDELILSYQELAALHIYTDGCELKYTNLKDSSFINLENLKGSNFGMYYYTWIQKTGGGYNGSARTPMASDSLIRALSKDLLPTYPMMIERVITFVERKGSTFKMGDSKIDILDLNIDAGTGTTDFELELKKILLPIRISLLAKPDIYGKTDQDVIFWFKPNESFLSKLPVEKAIWVKDRFSKYSDSIYDAKIKEINLRRKQEFLREEPDSLLLDSLISSALVLNSAQLKRLGFRSNSNNEIEYDVVYKDYRIGAKPDKTYNVWMFSIYKKSGVPFFAPFRKRNLLAHFHGYGSKGIAGLQLLDYTLLPIENSLKNDKLLETKKIFKKELPNLIPVKLSRLTNQGTEEYSYFWFLDSPEFRAAIK
jgi:hypothetical protein